MKLFVALGLALTVAVVLVYASVFCRGAYGVNDDYQYLQRVYTGTFDPAHNEQTAMGRPTASWLLAAAYASCDGSVRRLVYLRLVALAGIILFVLTLYASLQRAGQSGRAALTVALCVAFSPACGVYAAWVAAILSPYALTLCLLAGLLLERRARDATTPWLRWTGAALLLLLACTLWQAAAPMALLAGFTATWHRCEQGEPLPSAVRASGALPAWIIVGATLVAYLLGQRLAAHLGWIHGVGLERMTLATSLRGKVRLLGELLRSGFTSWARFHSPVWEWLVAGATLTAAGTALSGGFARGNPTLRETAKRAALAGIMLLASVSPMLAASEDNAAYRSLPVLYTVVAFLAVAGARRWFQGAAAWAGTVAGSGLILLMGVNAAYHVRAGIVEPNVREYRAVSQLVRQQFKTMPTRLVYLPPPPLLLVPATMRPSWEYGLVSSPFSWVTKPFLLLVFHDQGMCEQPTWDRLNLVYREVGNPGLPVLNPMGTMLNETGVWRDDARWGRVQAFSAGWMYSPWFGYFNVREFPLIQHYILGSLMCVASKPDGLWFYKDKLGIFLTSKAFFPCLWVHERQEWVYLQDTDRSHCAAISIPAGQQFLLSGRPDGSAPEGDPAASLAAPWTTNPDWRPLSRDAGPPRQLGGVTSWLPRWDAPAGKAFGSTKTAACRRTAACLVPGGT